MNKNTYWNNNGTYQPAVVELNKLIPVEGSVDKPRSTNKKLEKFRKASNCYHDLFNNGLGNCAQEFRQVFGFASSPHKRRSFRGTSFSPSFYDKVEERMDEIVLAAALEQGIVYVTEEVEA